MVESAEIDQEGPTVVVFVRCAFSLVVVSPCDLACQIFETKFGGLVPFSKLILRYGSKKVPHESMLLLEA